MGISDEIERLEKLRQTGALSDAEFQVAKQRVLDESASANRPRYETSVSGSQIHGIDEKTWCTLMHASQLLVFVGGVGIVVPIVMWAISKDQSYLARHHGDRMMNWLISSFVYAVVSGLLVFVAIGIPLLIILMVLNVVFPIMAALKANEGKLWSYPMAIKFIRTD